MNKIRIICDGAEVVVNTFSSVDDIYKFLKVDVQGSMAGIYDAVTQKVVYVVPEKVSAIQEITGQEHSVVLELDGRALGKAVVKAINTMQANEGKSILVF